jgi:hypothetical protein
VAKRPLLDTDIVIDYLRKRPQAVSFIRSRTPRPFISAVTAAELYSGVRDGKERVELEGLAVAFRLITVTRAIAVRAGLFRRQYFKSHGVQLADALIAATAEELGAELFTLNLKHYPMLKNVMAPYQKG